MQTTEEAEVPETTAQVQTLEQVKAERPVEDVEVARALIREGLIEEDADSASGYSLTKRGEQELKESD